ncbi:MAG: nuclear transport factor 2 family protein [Steroidobacter sp.]
MSESLSPQQVLERLLDGISNQRWRELHHLFAEDAVVEYPFALPAPTQLKGREAIRAYFAGVARYPLELRARDVVMHETVNPEILIVEWTYDGLVTTTRRPFQVANIQVSTVRDGRIVASRDYHNHVALAEAVGRLPALLSALINEE